MSDAKSAEDKQDEPAEAAAADSRRASRKLTAMQPRTLRLLRAALAPVLALGAVGVHFAVNVPEKKVTMPKANKAKARPGKRGRKGARERTPQQMDAAWARWSEQPYDGEPIKGKWGRRMQAKVNKAVVLARKTAFEGAPEEPRVVVSGTQCRTVRCRFTLRSPFPHEPGLVVDALRRQMVDGKPLWRTVDAEPTEPPSPHSPKKDHYLQVTLGVRLDGLDTNAITFAAAKGATRSAED